MHIMFTLTLWEGPRLPCWRPLYFSASCIPMTWGVQGCVRKGRGPGSGYGSPPRVLAQRYLQARYGPASPLEDKGCLSGRL